MFHLPKPLSRSQRKKPAIPQTCFGCSITEMPPKNYPHCHQVTKRYLCGDCKAQTPVKYALTVIKDPNSSFIKWRQQLPSPYLMQGLNGSTTMSQMQYQSIGKSVTRMQKRTKLVCTSCKQLPGIVNDVVEEFFPNIISCVILTYLSEQFSNHLVITDTEYCRLPCGRRFCGDCYLKLSNGNVDGGCYNCICKQTHYLSPLYRSRYRERGSL
jgi:hypothetical protein